MTTSRDPAAASIDFEPADAGTDADAREPFMDQLESLGNDITRFVTTRPLAAVGIVLAVGFLLGRLAQR